MKERYDLKMWNLLQENLIFIWIKINSKFWKNNCLDIVAMVAPNLLNYDMLQQILPR